MADKGLSGFPDGANKGCMCTGENDGCARAIPKLCVSRIYYFLTFSMLGTFWMLLATFLRYLGLSATQAGIIAGSRPIVSGVSVAVWTHIADRFQSTKKPILLTAVISHCLLCLSLVFFKPQFTDATVQNQTCLGIAGNASQLYNSTVDSRLITLPSNRLLSKLSESSSTMMLSSVMSSPAPLSPTRYAVSLNRSIIGNCSHDTVTSLPTSVGFGALSLSLSQAFTMLLSLVLLNELLGASVTTMADVATYCHLGRANYVEFGWIRVWGAGGWALGVFSLTLVAEHFAAAHPSAGVVDSRVYLSGNYTIVFSTLAIIMLMSLLAGTLFEYERHSGKVASGSLRNTLRQVATPRMLLLCGIIFHAGLAIGVSLSFLFWRIQDLGGKQTLMGVSSLIASVSDVPVYIMAPVLIRRLRAERVVLIGLVCQVVYFVGIGLVTAPWAVLLFQPIFGGMHGLLWASAQAIFVPLSGPGTEALMIGLLHTLMYGLGSGIGSFAGGALVDHVGSRWTFLAFGFASCFVFAVHLFSLCYFGLPNLPQQAGFSMLEKSREDLSSGDENVDLELSAEDGFEMRLDLLKDAARSSQVERQD